MLDRHRLDMNGPMFHKPLPSFIQPSHSFRECGVEFSRSRVMLAERLALLGSQMKIVLDVLALSFLQDCTLLAHSGNLSG